MAVKRKRSTSPANEAATESSGKVNGTPRSTKSRSRASGAAVQSDWIDFRIRYYQARRGKKGLAKSNASDEPDVQPHPYIEGEEQFYAILPKTWSELMRYKKFRLTEEGDPMRVGDVVLVNNDNGLKTDGEVDIFKQWKAHVLEVRAKDAQHVYLRIYWVYDPEELPGGRRPYHGEYELVPSNDMAVVDAMTVNGLVSLKKWDEYDDDDDPDTGTDEVPGFFWRQTYNVQKRQLSQLRQHCFCNLPSNPDNLLVQCTNKAPCGRWLHGDCLKEKAVQKAIADHESDQNSGLSPSGQQRLTSETPKKSTTTPNKGKKRTAGPSQQDGVPFAAEVITTAGKKGHRLKIRDLRSGHGEKEWEERIYCPCCSSLLVDEGEMQPETNNGLDGDNMTHDETASPDEITVQGGHAPHGVDGVRATPQSNKPSKDVEDPMDVQYEEAKNTGANGQAASTSP
ncbi:MAG: hypothetical protein M1821_008391 [Bathelium mastoideum]|nr:MAG: hypothetical protein M1821_008391 [Bathelium mastoideum]